MLTSWNKSFLSKQQQQKKQKQKKNVKISIKESKKLLDQAIWEQMNVDKCIDFKCI